MAVLAGFYGLVNWLRFGNLLWILVSSVGARARRGRVVPGHHVGDRRRGAAGRACSSRAAGRAPEVLGVLLVYALPLLFTVGLWTLVVLARHRRRAALAGDARRSAPGSPRRRSTSRSCSRRSRLAVVVALAVYAPRRPDVVGAGVALFLLVPLFIAVAAARARPGRRTPAPAASST